MMRVQSEGRRVPERRLEVAGGYDASAVGYQEGQSEGRARAKGYSKSKGV